MLQSLNISVRDYVSLQWSDLDRYNAISVDFYGALSGETFEVSQSMLMQQLYAIHEQGIYGLEQLVAMCPKLNITGIKGIEDLKACFLQLEIDAARAAVAPKQADTDKKDLSVLNIIASFLGQEIFIPEDVTLNYVIEIYNTFKLINERAKASSK